MVVIIIRHAEDNKDNSYKHDQTITKHGKKNTKIKTKKLIHKYGQPDIIFYSPLRRTKETLNIMLKYINNKNLKLIKDNRISRYFSSTEQKNVSISTITLYENIPIYESHNEFNRRCDDFLRNIIDIKKNNNLNVWIITHTLVIKRICKKLHYNIHPYLQFLQHYRLKI